MGPSTLIPDTKKKCQFPGLGFPAPFGPRKPVTMPGRMEKERSLTAMVEP